MTLYLTDIGKTKTKKRNKNSCVIVWRFLISVKVTSALLLFPLVTPRPI